MNIAINGGRLGQQKLVKSTKFTDDNNNNNNNNNNNIVHGMLSKLKFGK